MYIIVQYIDIKDDLTNYTVQYLYNRILLQKMHVEKNRKIF